MLLQSIAPGAASRDNSSVEAVAQLGGLARQVASAIGAYARSKQMKVIDGLTAVAPGETVSMAELALPVAGRHGVLLVFWKST